MVKHPVQVIAVTGGKGGVGKTNVSVNLALALAELGRRVMLMDADLGLANIDVLLGLTPKRTLADVISGECDLRDVILQGPGGVRVVPAASGTQSMVQLSPMQHAGLIQAFSDISDNLDVLIVDTAAGIGDSVVSFVRAAQEVLVVVCDEPTSITDAYALIKLLNRDFGMNRFRVLANMAHTPQEGRNLFTKLSKVTDRFLDVALQYVGAVPYDESVRKAVQKQRAVYEAFPRSKCSLAFKAIAEKVDAWPLPANPRGHLEFFCRASGPARHTGNRAMSNAGLRMYSKAQAMDAQHQLIERYAPLVKRIAYHLLARLPANVQVDDLIQAGMLGLLEASKKYDASKGASFETFAGIRIRGSMLDEVRKGDWAPRSVHRNSRMVSDAIRKIEARTGRDAKDQEVAAELQLSLEDYYGILGDTLGSRLFSFDDLLQDGEQGGLQEDVNSHHPGPSRELEDERFQSALADAIGNLPERERLVLSLYYDEELNLKEIGEVLGVSESRVSQLHSQCAARLRARLSEWRAK